MKRLNNNDYRSLNESIEEGLNEMDINIPPPVRPPMFHPTSRQPKDLQYVDDLGDYWSNAFEHEAPKELVDAIDELIQMHPEIPKQLFEMLWEFSDTEGRQELMRWIMIYFGMINPAP